MVDLTQYWPSWGDTGDKPADGTNYSQGDNVDAATLDYLWSTLRSTFSEIETAIGDVETLANSKADNPHGDDAHDNTVPSQSALDTVSNAASTNSSDIDSLQSTVAGKANTAHDHTTADESAVPDSGLVENYLLEAEYNPYTDTDAVGAVDEQVSTAANSVSGLDTQVASNDGRISALESQLNEYEIQVNGSGGTNVINLKTE